MQRTTVGLLALGVLFVSLAIEAQAKVHRIGVLSPFAQPVEPPIILNALRQVLRERDWVEGQHFTFELRYAAGQYDRLPMLAAELVQLPVDMLLAVSTSGAQAAQHATGSRSSLWGLRSGGSERGHQPGAAGRQCNRVALTPTWDIVERLQLLGAVPPDVPCGGPLESASPAHSSALSAAGGCSRVGSTAAPGGARSHRVEGLPRHHRYPRQRPLHQRGPGVGYAA